MESFIRTLFTQNPYHSFTVDDIKEAILENQDKIQNVSVFIRNDSLAEKIKHFLDKFMDEAGFMFGEPDKLMYYPDVKINERLDEQKEIISEQNKRISELQKQIEENNKKIEELTKKLEELSVKDTKKKFFLF
jgi:predicted RNase H-like nuclease (RuvC/YqgF family)